MLVREIMTSPAVTIRPGDEVAEAARVLDRLSITSLPVVDSDGRLVGVIGEADVISRIAASMESTEPEGSAEAGVHRGDATPRVRDAMTRRALSVQADDDVADVVALMAGTALKSLPVVLHSRVVGMVSRRDVVRTMAHGGFDAPVTDEHAPA